MKKITRFLAVALFIFATSATQAQDVAFDWAKGIGGNGFDIGNKLVVDDYGNVYVVGFFNDTIDVDPGFGTHYLVSNGGNDIFILKLNDLGNLEWAFSLGGASDDGACAISIDSFDKLIIAGTFVGTVDFDPSAGNHNLNSFAGSQDAFILKVNLSGGFIWAKSFGGSGIEDVRDLDVDNSGNVYCLGQFEGSVDFDPGMGTDFLLSNGAQDCYVAKFDAGGNFLWAFQIGSIHGDSPEGIAVSDLFLAITGEFLGTADFDPSMTNYYLTSNGFDAFVATYDLNGNLFWAKRIGKFFSVINSFEIEIDNQYNVFTTGFFLGTIDFDPGEGVFNMTSSTKSSEAFILKLHLSGNFIWARKFGADGGAGGFGLYIDGYGSIYTAGNFNDTADFDPGPNVFNLISQTGPSCFISKLNSLGNFEWAINYGHGQTLSVQSDFVGNVYSTGWFVDTSDFNPGAGTYNLISKGEYDAFILKLNPENISVSELSNVPKFKVYPIPTYNCLIIEPLSEILSFTVNIHNVLGQIISRQHFEKTDRAEILMAGQAKGLYMVEVIGDDGNREVIKVMKK